MPRIPAPSPLIRFAVFTAILVIVDWFLEGYLQAPIEYVILLHVAFLITFCVALISFVIDRKFP